MTHPKFGQGFVSEIVSDSKVEVTFKDAKRVLVHNRKNMPGLPLAAEGDGIAPTRRSGKKLKKETAKAAGPRRKKPVAAGPAAGRQGRDALRPSRRARCGVACGKRGGEGRRSARPRSRSERSRGVKSLNCLSWLKKAKKAPPYISARTFRFSEAAGRRGRRGRGVEATAKPRDQ